MAIPRMRPGAHPALLSYGFRPFFLLGSLYAGMAILFWLPLLYGRLKTYSAFQPIDWHVHEMMFGYLAAVVTGFLLTAIPNWTGRLPVQGLPLLGLVVLWLAGRFAVFFSAETGWLATAALDCGFLLAVSICAAIEIIAGRNWRNLKVLLPVAVLLTANAMFHAEAHYQGTTDVSRRLGLGAAVVLVMIIGGRIVPSFTRNWLARENKGRLPVPFGRFDMATIALSALALAGWAFLPESTATGGMLIVTSVLNTIRLGRWAGDRALRDPLVLVLHVAFLFVPVGLLLAGLAVLVPETIPAAAGIHAFSVGALASMTLAVMSRATLGHTGRELGANFGTSGIFIMIVAAAVLRIAAAFLPAQEIVLQISACLWVIAFLGFTVLFGRMLLQPRLQSKQPSRAVS